MAKMDKSERLAYELRQIILADRMAIHMIRDAQEVKQSVEDKTASEKERILKEAEEKQAAMLARVQEEKQEELAKRKQEAIGHFEVQKEGLQQKMQAGQEKWIEEITAQMTALQGV